MHGHATGASYGVPAANAPKATPVLQRMEGVNISLTDLRGKLQTLCNRLGVGTPANDVAAPPPSIEGLVSYAEQHAHECHTLIDRLHELF